MRFYVVGVQHNAETGTENRGVPKAYDRLNEAKQEFHRALSVDMKNPTLDWSFWMVINDAMGVEKMEKYVADPVPEVVEPVAEVAE